MELGVLDHVPYGAYRPHHVHLLYVADDGSHLDDGSEHDVSSFDELARQRLLPALPICHHDSAVPSQATTILGRWILDGGKVSVCCPRDGFLPFSIWATSSSSISVVRVYQTSQSMTSSSAKAHLGEDRSTFNMHGALPSHPLLGGRIRLIAWCFDA